jgi:hypothetical protein
MCFPAGPRHGLGTAAWKGIPTANRMAAAS